VTVTSWTSTVKPVVMIFLVVTLLVISSQGFGQILDKRVLQCKETCKSLYWAQEIDSSLKACRRACDDGFNSETCNDTYADVELSEAYKRGCSAYRNSINVDIANIDVQDDIPTIFSRLDNFFQAPFPTFPTLNFQRDNNNMMKIFPDGIFGRKDDDIDPFSSGEGEGIFNRLHEQMASLINSIPLPQMSGARSWRLRPFQMQNSGEMTIVRSGPGYHTEKHYNIGPNGELTQKISEDDALKHKNPMDTGVNFDQVELIDPYELVKEQQIKEARNMLEKTELLEPVSNHVNEADEEALIDLQESFNRDFVSSKRYSCSGVNTAWSDWVACLHQKVGIPRWLTAATIALGIVFSIWLCLVIPSSAPKQKVKKTNDPPAEISTAAMKAKEAEASAVNIDEMKLKQEHVLSPPPTYQEVTAGLGMTVNLEPVHEKKQESVA